MRNGHHRERGGRGGDYILDEDGDCDVGAVKNGHHRELGGAQ
jgi:hypothetical protein